MSHVNTGQPLAPERQRLVCEAYDRLGSFTAVERETGIRRRTVRRYVRARGRGETQDARRGSIDVDMPPILAELMAEHRPPAPPPSGPTPEAIREHTESGDTAEVVLASPHRIRTLEDAIAFAEVDTSVWRVERWSCTSWETGMKLRTFHDNGKVARETPRHMHLWRVRIDLRRILPRPLQKATEAIFEAMKAYAPKYAPTPPRKTPDRPHLCVVDLFDVHFGKLCWAPETNDAHFDLRIAEQLYRNAVVDILNESAHREIEEFVLPIGQDFFHVDNAQNTTTNGTPQDTDGRLAKIIETGERAVIWAIEQLASIAPVHVKYVPGNHDRLLSYTLTRTIAAWFRNCDRVTVDLQPTTRKAHRYGSTLLAFTHGDEEKISALAGIMANEFKQDFCETTCHEWHRGHMHRPKKVETTPVNYAEGVVIRDLMSLSAVDFWHYRKGFIGGTRAAEAYFYDKTLGFVCQYVAKARMS